MQSQNDAVERLIVGGGIAGLSTALALAHAGLPATVLERDPPPPSGEDGDRAFFDWPRRGAAQFRHPHAFLGLLCNLLETRYPALLEALYAAGARRVDYQDMLPVELREVYRPEEGDERLWVLMCRRAILETQLRRAVEALPEVRLLSQVHVEGLRLDTSGARPRVLGVTLRRDSAERYGPTLDAEVVIDASGRTSKLPRWLAAQGISISEQNDDAEIVYYTRHYRRLPGVEEPTRGGKDPGAGDLGYLKYGVFPGDAGNFAIILCVHRAEQALHEAVTDSARFDAICSRIPGLAPWLEPGTFEARTEAFGIGDIRSVWRHYLHQGEPVVDNLFAVGDAALRTNPLYGRGCSTSVLHAHILADVLSSDDDPVRRARRFDERTEAELRPIFQASLTEDRRGIRRALAAMEGSIVERADGPRSLKQRFTLAFGDALAAAARHNLRVNRGMMRTVNLLEPPGAFLKDWRTQAIIYGYMLRGRPRNAAARIVRGPERGELLDQLAQPL
ncbi:MAG: FAD-dependent oxidoreductase [Pseudomonadota bacterium]